VEEEERDSLAGGGFSDKKDKNLRPYPSILGPKILREWEAADFHRLTLHL
jgi:hypothetical protein